jgi:spore maturation protein CgeB
MKVLLFAARFYGYQDAIRKALSQLGADVELHAYLPLGDREDLGARLLGRVLPRCGMPGFVRRADRATNARFLRLVQGLRPDVVLVVKGEVLTPETLRRARENSPGTVFLCWFMDMLRSYPQVEPLLPCYDRFFTYSWSDQQELSALHPHVEWLPLAFDPDVHRPRPPSGPEAWVSFIGRVDRQRIAVLRPVVEQVRALGGHSTIYGGIAPGIAWLRHLRRYDPFILEQVIRRSLPPEEAAQVYGRSRICLNVHAANVAPAEPGRIGHNMRFFEICGAGGLQLVDRLQATDQLCEPGRDVLEYSGREDLLEQVARCVHDRGLRRRVASAGHATMLARHTFVHRAERLLRAAQACGAGTRTVLLPRSADLDRRAGCRDRLERHQHVR